MTLKGKTKSRSARRDLLKNSKWAKAKPYDRQAYDGNQDQESADDN